MKISGSKFILVLFTLCLSNIVYSDSDIDMSHDGDFSSIKPSEKILFKKVDNNSLFLHVFNPKDFNKTYKKPVVVFFFGGGWINGGAGHFYRQSQYFASRGIVAICAEYRTRKKHKTTPKESVIDGKSAIRWIRSHAEQLGIDPQKIIASGGSAGGHIAAATGMLTGFNEVGEDLSIDSSPNAMILFNPVIDNSRKGYGYNRVKNYWQSFSPLHNIHKKTPPAIVFLGTKDIHLSVSSAKEFQQKMRAFGIRSELYLYKDKEHGFYNFKKTHYLETLLKSDDFLTSLGYLSPRT